MSGLVETIESMQNRACTRLQEIIDMADPRPVLTVLPTARTPNQSLIDHLMDLLAKAQAGEIDDMAMVWTDPDHYVQSWWFGQPIRCIGQLAYLQFRLCTELREEALREPPRTP